eukprot:SAG31_NODE_18571_length_631_cov_0.969925_1_plen_52_part_10
MRVMLLIDILIILLLCNQVSQLKARCAAYESEIEALQVIHGSRRAAAFPSHN